MLLWSVVRVLLHFVMREEVRGVASVLFPHLACLVTGLALAAQIGTRE